MTDDHESCCSDKVGLEKAGAVQSRQLQSPNPTPAQLKQISQEEKVKGNSAPVLVMPGRVMNGQRTV